MLAKLSLQNFQKEHRNIKVAYLLTFLSELYFPITVWIFFYLRFLDFTQVAAITAIQTIVSIIFEIPTGAFADMVGRKLSVLISFVLYSLAMFITAGASAFWMFAALEVVKGISIALYSGSLEALVYDTLKEQGKEEHYDQVNSNLRSIEWIALLLSAVVGGFIYSLQFQSPYIVQGIFYVAAAISCLFLIEPRIDSVKYSFVSFFKQNGNGFKELFHSQQTIILSFALIAISMGYYVTANFLGISQAKQYGLDSFKVGLLFGAGYILSAVASQLYPTLKTKYGISGLLVGTSLVLVGSLLLANFVGLLIGGGLIIIRIASSSIFNNVRSSVVNSVVGSRNRATAISTMALLYKIPYVLLALVMGSYIDNQSPNAFAWILGIGLTTLIGVLLTLKYFSDKKAVV